MVKWRPSRKNKTLTPSRAAAARLRKSNDVGDIAA